MGLFTTKRHARYIAELHLADGSATTGHLAQGTAAILQSLIKRSESLGKPVRWAMITKTAGGDSIVAYYQNPAYKEVST